MNLYAVKDIYPLRKLLFEDVELNFPHNLHNNLTGMYGDYMQLPPEEKRKNHYPYELEFLRRRKRMINFTVGPVQSSEEVRKIGYEQVPYFRTSEFSDIMFENERLMLKFAKADDDARTVFITGSGTASMEAVIMNTLTVEDKVLIVNGGSFGQRFVDLCEMYEIPYSQIKLETGKALQKDTLELFNGKGYSAFVVNVHETSTGVHYDMKMISDFCRKNKMFLIVDAISSFFSR